MEINHAQLHNYMLSKICSQELSGSIYDLEKSRSDATVEADQLHSQKLSIEQQLDKLKQSLHMVSHPEYEPSRVTW